MAREMGATHVISVNLPMQGVAAHPRNVFQVVNRCFQIMQSRTENDWRGQSDLVISPHVRNMQWDCFGSAMQLIDAGEQAALEALPRFTPCSIQIKTRPGHSRMSSAVPLPRCRPDAHARFKTCFTVPCSFSILLWSNMIA